MVKLRKEWVGNLAELQTLELTTLLQYAVSFGEGLLNFWDIADPECNGVHIKGFILKG